MIAIHGASCMTVHIQGASGADSTKTVFIVSALKPDLKPDFLKFYFHYDRRPFFLFNIKVKEFSPNRQFRDRNEFF